MARRLASKITVAVVQVGGDDAKPRLAVYTTAPDRMPGELIRHLRSEEQEAGNECQAARGGVRQSRISSISRRRK
jgi:hypothetical protein